MSHTLRSLALSLMLTAPSAFAAVDAEMNDLFKLPMPNALKVLRRQAQLHPELERVSFDEKETMDRRWRAFGLLIQLRQAAALPLIERALVAPEWYMRNLGLLGIEEVASARVVPEALKLLSDRALVVRSSAVSVLRKQVGKNEVREALWEELHATRNFRKGSSLWIRGQIVTLLAEDPVRGEKDRFIKILSDGDARLHVPTFAALEKITGQKVGKGTESPAKRLQLWKAWAQSSANRSSL